MKTTSFGTLGRSALFLIVTYAAMFVAVQVTQKFVSDESLAPVAAMMLVQVAALVIARRMGARAAAYLVGGFAATLLSELLIQGVYGVHSLHSAPVHYAVALAAGFGVGVGVLVAREPSTNRTASEHSPQAVR